MAERELLRRRLFSSKGIRTLRSCLVKSGGRPPLCASTGLGLRLGPASYQTIHVRVFFCLKKMFVFFYKTSMFVVIS
jgi:hypothetical protein